jgi:hypothetical protein
MAKLDYMGRNVELLSVFNVITWTLIWAARLFHREFPNLKFSTS